MLQMVKLIIINRKTTFYSQFTSKQHELIIEIKRNIYISIATLDNLSQRITINKKMIHTNWTTQRRVKEYKEIEKKRIKISRNQIQ